ncbi:MAG TPA: FeoA family protein [Bacteroidales bacterium]|jgi:ferrous iron transport protein A|nr:FeoA family protein [Bacteroidales bacterium]HQH23208.1 FeoA family protein [Bacteroidales bacterium]HQJ80934.1 FeoA family protein [Bacteroidales bacterium]
MDTSGKPRSLIDLQEGQSGIVLSLNGGRNLTKRLADLGMGPGTRITVLRTSLFSGPVQVEVTGSKLVLGRGLASKILVEPR